ncbi:MAG: cytochrome-c peroxidase [Planctomycetia bacterium]|nr:cytochrome-c peroxidase [Planctomycetia bacterium]
MHDWPSPQIDPGVEWEELGPLPDVRHPPENPFSPAKAELGKALFFDPRLSGSQEIACASCHDPDLAWADGRTVSFGHHREPLKRNAPTIRNVAFQQTLFWDGRADSIEAQVEQVLLNPAEMHITPAQLVRALEQVPAYQTAFAESFADQATPGALGTSGVVGGRSRFDRFVTGERELLTDQELNGLDLFRRKARCMNCHHGPLFSDGRFHNVGLSYYGRKAEDLGRYRVTGKAEDVGRFRTPSLRDVTNTEPLMHNGLFRLSGVLNMYNAGMPTPKRRAYQENDPLFPRKSPHLQPLNLTQQELADLAAFLATLAEPYRRIRPPSPADGP